MYHTVQKNINIATRNLKSDLSAQIEDGSYNPVKQRLLQADEGWGWAWI